MTYPKLVTEDWKREYEKIILSRKFATASALLGLAFSNPTEFTIKQALGASYDCVQNMPIGENKDHQDRRDDMLKELDEIEIVIFGKPDSKATADMKKKYGIETKMERRGVKMVPVIQNFPEVLKHLRSVLVKAGDFATSIGLRVTLPKEHRYGMERLLEEEGFTEEDMEEME